MRTFCKEALMAKLLMFHGAECPHCKNMMTLVEKLEKETEFRIEKLEVWHNETNANLMRSYKPIIAPKCGGQLRVPTFVNPDSADVFCGEVGYDELKAWAAKQ